MTCDFMDNLSRKQRSYCMSMIRSKNTKPERIVHTILKKLKIKHIMHPKIKGSSDIVVPKEKIAIFINGCFWHKCPKCFKPPKSNKEYWIPKIKRNVQRDKENIKILKRSGYKTIVLWEHEIK